MRLMDLADECAHMKSFVHLSPATTPNDYSASSSSPVQERIYPLGLGDPETLLNQTLGMDIEEMTRMTQRVLQYFPNTYLYTKALAEHLLLKRAESKRVHEENGTREQYPIAIMRISSVGAAVSEPLVGWADSVAGPCGMILLIGKGMQPIQTSEGENLLDIVPVDYVVRLILGCAASIKAPGTEFIPPYPEYLHSSTDQDTRPPSLAGSVSNDSTRPPSSVTSPSYQRSSTATSRSSRPLSQKFEPKDTTYFPYIYNVSVQSLDPISCRDGYDIIREYWTRTTSVVIPTSQSYFSPPPNSGGLSRARTMMRTFTSMVGGVPASSGDAMAGVPKRSSQRLSRTIEKASKLSEGTKGFARQSAVFLDHHVHELKLLLSQADNRADYDLQEIIPDDAGPTFWKSYLLDASYGVHYYVGQETGLRNDNLPADWDCAIRPRATLLYQGNTLHQLVIDRPIHSAIFSLAQVNQRIDRMVSHVEDAVVKPNHGQVRPKNLLEAEAMKKHDEEWLTDLDDALADWCEDVLTKDAPDGSTELGRWRVKIGDNDEAVKVLVLNDKRVGASLKQIVQNAGVPQQTGINEAMVSWESGPVQVASGSNVCCTIINELLLFFSIYDSPP
jgi:Male sterility protein